MEPIIIWGIGHVALSVFRPVLEELAKDVVKDAAKSYVGECFKNVFSVIHKKPLTKATGLALKELLEQIEDELLDAEMGKKELSRLVPAVKGFVDDEEVKQTISSLYLDPEYKLDPGLFAGAWKKLSDSPALPEGFSWQRITKRFARKIREIRNASAELKVTFESLSKARTAEAVKELVGLPPDFDLDKYREALVERFGNLSFDSLDTSGAYYSAVKLWSVFVPQSARECHEYVPQLLEIPKEHQKRLMEKGELGSDELVEADRIKDKRRQAYFSQPLRPVLEVCADSSLTKLVILGDPGSGKSSLLRFMALEWAGTEDVNERYTSPLPLVIDLRDYNRWECSNGKSFVRYLHAAPNWHRLNQQTLDHLLKQPGRVVLMLDGLDEIFDPVQREEVVNDIHRFSNDYKSSRVIVTSRVVGYKATHLRNAEFQHFMLQDLEPEKIENFLKRWHDVTFDDRSDADLKRKRLSKAIRESKSIAMLAGNPLLLTMMAILNRNQELPRDRADLYDQASRVLLQQWDMERALEEYSELKGEVDLRAKTDILRAVASAMQAGPKGLAGNIIDGETLTALIEGYLHEELHFKQARSAAKAVVRQMRERNFILCFLGADSYAFVHRTFLEYFCATNIVHRFNVEKSITEKDLITLFDEHCREDDWREVLRLICAQIDEQFVGQIVEHLATRTDLDEWNGETSLLELPLSILCLCEVRNASKLKAAGEKLLHASVKVYSNGETDLILNVLKAAKELGTQWPSGNLIASMAIPKIKELSHGARLYWPQFVGALYPNKELILELLASDLSEIRWDAIICLADNWQDEGTRTLIAERAVKDEYHYTRGAALRALVRKWPDYETRKLITERAVKDEDPFTRGAALEFLADDWPDDETRKLITERAVKDEGKDTRKAALEALADNWPDDETRKLLTERVVKDEGKNTRSAALKALADNWPDDETRKLLTECAVKDARKNTRKAALRLLAYKWPDDETREFLTERAVIDEKEYTRSAALEALADKWPDDETRELLIERAVIDEKEYTRSAALEVLADKWPDDETRELLTERAVIDEKEYTRSAALEALADKWPDDETRELLIERAVIDEKENTRSAALEALADKWPGEETRSLIADRAPVDGAAASILGKEHSQFGHIIFCVYEDEEFSTFLDPGMAVPRVHIEEVAERIGIEKEKIAEMVRSLSNHMGWDITKGSGASEGN